MENLENEIKELKSLILRINNKITDIEDEISKNSFKINEIEQNKPEKILEHPPISDGHARTHSQRTHARTHIIEENRHFSTLNDEINQLFSSLTNKEFQIFLTLYDLEDTNKLVSYNDIASKLKFTESCVRSYISSLVKKNLPIIRKKHLNKVVYLYIDDGFRKLNLKQKLINIYYNQDIDQRKLL